MEEEEKQKKHLAMVERLSKRSQSRSQNPESSSESESTSSILSRFSQLKTSIESQLTESQSLSSDPFNLKLHFNKISESISHLEKLVAENSYSLPSYDVRTSLKTVSDLKHSLHHLTAQLLPKKKFSFKNKPTTATAKKDSAFPQPKHPPELSTPLAPRDSPGFSNKTGDLLIADFRNSEVGEFTLSDLDSCQVRILGSLRALFVHRLNNSTVYVGPVTGSVLIEEAEGCVFALASHQIRIHSANKSDFYLRVRSRPIIEHCNGIRFAPYCLSYQGIEDDLRGAALDSETGNWANVDDFRWLRAVQSPNWSVLPENERVGTVDISNLKNGDKEI